MIVDTSALLAIALDEPEAADFAERIIASELVEMSAVTHVEFTAVMSRTREPAVVGRAARLVRLLGVQVAPVTTAQADVAARAYEQYGKGCGHPAGLNLGDVFAYALAMDRDRPLLFKGDDFGHTDVRVA